MRIDFAVMSSDDNPVYLDFWNPVSLLWKYRIGIEPVLILIANERREVPEACGRVVYWEPIPGIPIYLQCLWSRYWYPSTQPDATFIITDIDMPPISPWYYTRQLDALQDSSYVHINPPTKNSRLPSYYHIAKGRRFRDLLALSTHWQDSLQELLKYYEAYPCGGQSGRQYWFLNEQYATHKLSEYRDQLLLLKRNGGTEGRRIDRSHLEYDPRRLACDYY